MSKKFLLEYFKYAFLILFHNFHKIYLGPERLQQNNATCLEIKSFF